MDLSNIIDMLKNPQALKMQAEEMQKKMNAIQATGQARHGQNYSFETWNCLNA